MFLTGEEENVNSFLKHTNKTDQAFKEVFINLVSISPLSNLYKTNLNT